MASVTARISEIKQPNGGYLSIRKFNKIEFQGGIEELSINENVHSSLIGMAVDYLSRYMLTNDVMNAFKISSFGAFNVKEQDKFLSIIKNINGLDDISIISALKLCGYDVAYRVGPLYFRSVETINPNKETINNVRIMVNRCLYFFRKYGPIVSEGFDFEGGYSKIVNKGDGDFLTQDTLWDFKVSKSTPTTQNTLQLLMYYIMGKKSGKDIFKSINKIGIFNPKLNRVYIYNICAELDDVIRDIEKNVICY